MMRPFRELTAVAAPLLRSDIDTDIIMPSREMKAVSKTGLGDGLFAGWRYTAPSSREPNPDFVLNRPDYAGTEILLAGANFGCGSSREYAVWALKEYGIRAILAPSFGVIFQNNCIRNGILPITLDESIVAAIAADVAPAPQARKLFISLVDCQVRAPDGAIYDFTIAAQHREMLLDGLDAIDVTLKHRDEIAAFEAADQERRPWVHAFPPEE